jgi:hypothetical protein
MASHCDRAVAESGTEPGNGLNDTDEPSVVMVAKDASAVVAFEQSGIAETTAPGSYTTNVSGLEQPSVEVHAFVKVAPDARAIATRARRPKRRVVAIVVPAILLM